MPRAKSRSSRAAGSGYLDFVRTVHLNGVGLDSATLKVERSLLSLSSGSSENPHAEVSGRQEAFDITSESFSVRGDYKVAISGVEGKEVVTIYCTYSASFSLDAGARKSEVERFASNEVRLVFWPYLRQFVSDTTARMSIPPLVLPLTSELRAHPSSAGNKGA
jgi:hypothetical protein